MRTKKANTLIVEKYTCEKNRHIATSSSMFWCVAPVNTTCAWYYFVELTNRLNSGDRFISIINSLHQAGYYYPDYNNNYACYEVRMDKDHNGKIKLAYEPI